MSIYRLLLRAFPRRIRVDFGDDMVRLFELQRRAARESSENMVRFWFHACTDVVAHGLAERMALVRALLERGIRHRSRWRWWMHALRHDVRYAFRLLARQRGITVISVLTLAMGIGANTAIFSAVDAVLLRPLPYEDPDRLVMVWERRAAEGVLDNAVAPADFVDWSRMNTVFESMAAFAPTSVDLTSGGEPSRIPAGVVSPTFFEVLKVRPAAGRTFTRDEGKVGRDRVVVLGYGLWERRFGLDPSVTGRTLVLNGVPHEVVGVLPRSFEFPDPSIEVWAPLAFEGTTEPLSRATHNFFVYARMKPGITLPLARAEMDRLGAQLSHQYPDTNARHGIWVAALRDQIAGPVQRSAVRARGIRTGLLLLLGAAALVLLIACVNVANLLLARAAGRRREMGVRAALGAGRARLVGQALVESMVLGTIGGAVALLVAYWGIAGLRRWTPTDLTVVGSSHLSLDVRAMIFTFVLSLATGVLLGLLPAWSLAGQDINASLKEGGRTAAAPRRALRLMLVVSEIALASLLLVGAGLALRSFQALLRSEPGFDGSGVLTAFAVLPTVRYPSPERRVGAAQEIERRLAAIPGVRVAGATSHLPLSGQDGRRGILVEGRADSDAPTRAHPRSVSPGYFRTMAIRLTSGRLFTDADRAAAPPVAIVNDTMARSYWPGQSPVGRRVTFTGTQTPREIVGVIRDVRHWGLDAPVNPEMYLPLAQSPSQALTFVISTDRDPLALVSAVREELRSVDPQLPLSNVRPMAEVAARSVASQRASLWLLSVFGLLALVLAAAGIYGVMSHLVALRSSEIGIRITLGARPSELMRLVMREGLMQALVGLAIGLAAALLVMRGFQWMLYEISPVDPITLGSVAAILIVTALAACAVPARRAMRVDPVQALRE
jgi:predicted permease